MNDFVVSVNESKFEVKILDETRMLVNRAEYNFELLTLSEHSYLLKLNNQVFDLTAVHSDNHTFKIYIDGQLVETTVRTALQEKAYKLLEGSAGSQKKHTDVKAPMPGLILKVKKKEGERVEMGDSIVILEAMKMENDLKAHTSGMIEKIYITEGSAVEKGSLLFSII
jgi:biotin carboxyl carrier protein